MRKFKNAINYENKKCDVWYTHTDSFDDIPDELVLKAHGVCFLDGKILLVNHSEWNVWGIPGGTRESGESIEQTLIREIKEETNCEVLNYKPICYQKIVSPNNDIHYRLQYICNIKSFGEFRTDSDGSINKILYINPNDFKKYIEKKEFREIVLVRAINVYKKHYENRKNWK